MEVNKIYNENCLDTMARMPDGFVDLTVTSPPYDNLRTYNGYSFDFVVRDKDGYTQYIQVAFTVKEKTTLERELAPFNKIPDFNERLLITMDYETGNHNGVKQINAIDWLLKQ